MPHTRTEPLHHLCVPITPVLSHPDANAICTSEALYGETIEVLSREGDWAAIRQSHDGYEGFMDARYLQIHNPDKDSTSTHWVTQRNTLLFQQADIKSPLIHRLPFGAELVLTDRVSGSFSQTACGHHVWTAHCLPLSQNYPADPLELAKTVFLGTAYRWGGRSPEGIDCSGLVQALARSQGLAIPRDSGDQEAFLQVDVKADDWRAMDLVFWPNHTGILVSPTEILHATAHFLSCVIEPLESVMLRAGPVSSVKRLF